jgi:hypothetical protein
MTKELIAVHPTIDVEMERQDDQSSSVLLVHSRTRPEDTATGDDSQYNEQRNTGMIINENLSTTSAVSLILAARSALHSGPNSSFSSQVDGSEAFPILHPITTEGDEAGMQELEEGSQGELDSVTVRNNGGYNEQTVVARAPLTKTNPNARSPIAKDDVLAANALSPILMTGSTLRSALGTSLPIQTDNFEVNQGTDPTAGDGAGTQDHRKATSGGARDNVAIGIGNRANMKSKQQ